MNSSFELNLSIVLSHSIVWETKQLWSPNGVVDDARGDGDPAAKPVGESTDAQMQAYIKNLPALLNTTANQTLPVGQTTQNAQNTLAPQQQQLLSDLFSKYAPGLYKTGDELNQQESSAGIAQALKNLQGGGGQLSQAAIDADKAANPEYYSTRAAAGSKLNDLLGSIDINGLSGSERSEVERSNAQQDAQRGIANTPSQTATVQNAMQFGSALQAKRNALSNAISTATSFLPSSKSGVDAFAVGTGAATAPQGNAGAGQFLGIGNNANSASGTNASLGNSLLGGINATSNNAANIDANRRNSLDMTNSTLSSLPT